jgi:hypothetical protein
MCDQSSDRSAAGMVGAENLPEKDSKGHEWREDPVLPRDLDTLERLGDVCRRQDVAEREPALRQELLSQRIELTVQTSMPR